ncbi:MAG TPA: fused MFS/spermidine synthase [Chthoniobacterales bacterium]|jgi:predicted O-methyltransferase YrrM|nr:fused MFS/spermidine synthase [Chthoniobacterales bacterium]
MRPPPFRHASKYGVIKLRFRKRSCTLTYEQKGGDQSTADRNGISLDAHIHALYGLTLQHPGKRILMIGCGGGTLATMLARAGRRVSIVEIDPVSLRLAKRYFGLPRSVACHVGDGLAFMQKTRRRCDVLIIDAFTGETIPAHMKSAAFFEAAGRCLRRNGMAAINVCLERKADPVADRIAAGFKEMGFPVRILDSPGGERNAIVLAGNVEKLRRPKLLIPPQADAKLTGKELQAMRFRRRRAAKS